MFLLFFFFKQKTAYEMRISDWSSDVCSSDLLENRDERAANPIARILREAEYLRWERRRHGRGEVEKRFAPSIGSLVRQCQPGQGGVADCDRGFGRDRQRVV